MGAFEIGTHGATLETALSLALAGGVTSVALRKTIPALELNTAAMYLSRYTERGYLRIIEAGRFTRGHTTSYAITAVGMHRLQELKQRRRDASTPTPTSAFSFAPLLAVFSSPFAMGATGST